MSIRTQKVAGLIRDYLSEPLRRIASEMSAGLITVTSVRVSDDLKIATVYLSVYGGKASAAKVLERIKDEKGRIRHSIAGKLTLRSSPDLRFFLDDTLDAMDNIQALLDKVKRDDEAAGRTPHKEETVADEDEADTLSTD
ncbi:MAG: 30S ribosome-binding factor RbfA [Ignavibacteriae bacterium]|nr:30S ribosome-binding factor RbfA [Ignavibacteriota bacterium]